MIIVFDSVDRIRVRLDDKPCLGPARSLYRVMEGDVQLFRGTGNQCKRFVEIATEKKLKGPPGSPGSLPAQSLMADEKVRVGKMLPKGRKAGGAG